MGDHKRSKRFRNDDFSLEILEESLDRKYIEEREKYWIEKYDSFNSGLNESREGKGYNHGSSNFTTLGFKFSEESKRKMSESAKTPERAEHMRKICREMWGDPEMRKHHSAVRKGKRLRRIKLSDEQIDEIRKHFNQIKDELKPEVDLINQDRHKRNSSWKKTNAEMLFSKKFSSHYGVTLQCIAAIVKNKCRLQPLPSICSLKS